YQSNHLRTGTYTVAETQPAGWLDGKDTIGNIPGTTGNDQFSGIVLGSGTQSTANNFGELKAASLSGFVYVDANNNGVKDTGEAGISGVQITLSAAGVSPQTATTDASGGYAFNNLTPATYTLSESQPANYLDG